VTLDWVSEGLFLVHLCQECGDVGCLIVGELVLMFECGSRLCKESVVSFTFALSFGFALLLFRLFRWIMSGVWRRVWRRASHEDVLMVGDFLNDFQFAMALISSGAPEDVF
jgi:hypothetical protein